MKITTTKGAGTDQLKVLVHGPAGAGKTRLAGTTGDLEGTIIISAEAGLLSLREFDLAVFDITGQGMPPMAAMQQAYAMIRADIQRWRYVFLDSISEVAEVCLADELTRNKDGRAAYGEMAGRMIKTIKAFRDLPTNVVMTCKQEHISDDGRLLYGPSLPGKKLSGGLSYYFDEVFALRNSVDAEGRVQRSLQTQRCSQFDAKDRSGALEMFEPADIGHIANKIRTHHAPAPMESPTNGPTQPAV